MSDYFEDMADELARLIEAPVTVDYEYRVYYNEHGQIYATADGARSAELHGILGDYLVVDQDVFLNSQNYYVENGKISWRSDITPLTVTALKKSNAGFAVLKNNAALLLDDQEVSTASDTEHYDYRAR
jgi:hypothetical protein